MTERSSESSSSTVALECPWADVTLALADDVVVGAVAALPAAEFAAGSAVDEPSALGSET